MLLVAALMESEFTFEFLQNRGALEFFCARRRHSRHGLGVRSPTKEDPGAGRRGL